jgi:hypothetical protein
MTDPAKVISDQPPDTVADHVIAECGGDPRAAVLELVTVVRHLAEEIRMLSAAASPGYLRRSLRNGKGQTS